MSGTSKGGGSVKKPDVDKNSDKGDIVLLWQPKDGKANVDIVFVHGVGGDKIGTWTWTQRPKDPDNPREDQVWPKDFLPEVLPSARILSFGYNADFAKFYPEERAKIAPNLTIDNYSTELLDKLSGLRQGEESNRPIIFVAHSMGGLVVANALSQAQTLEKGSVADQTIGAIFLGTPFEGSSLASYGSFGVRFLKYVMRVQPDNLKTLEQKSEKLADLNQNFARFLTTRYKDHDKPRLEIACYFEQLPTSVPLLGEIFVVPETSARWMGITPLSIEANHTGMCRFDLRQRSGYKSISEKMSQWVTAYQKNPNKGGVGGVDGKGISINVSGDIDYSNAEISGIATGHLTTTTPKGINITQNNDSKRSKRSRKTRKKRDSDDSNDSDSE